MQPCTSTNIHEIYLDDPYYFTIEESLYACHEAGFQAVDLNLHTADLPGRPLADDLTWRSWVAKVASIRDELGITFPSAHTYFYVWPVTDAKELARHEELLCRSIEAAGMLGVEWIVVHPYSVCDDAWYSRRRSLEYNLVYMRKYAQIARKYPNLGLAIENMVEDRSKRRFGSCAEDLLELYAALDDPVFGLCWDFGHGVRSNVDTCASLRQLGTKLKVVHVHDTNVDADHTLPFFGTTIWAEIMPVMKDIVFDGYWNYECHNYARFLPPDIRKTALKMAYDVNISMIRMSD